jgi:hypothetical protein
LNEFPSRTLTWLAEGFRCEYTSGLGPSFVMHVRGGKQSAGALVQRVERILDERYLLWAIERDLLTPGDYKGRGLRPKRGPDGRVLRRLAPDGWLLPFHESLKRLTPRGDGHGYGGLRAFWLRSYLLWHGSPCPCNHAGVVEHLAAESGVSATEVRCAIERAAREAARTLGDKVPGNPMAVTANQNLGGLRR